MGGSGGDVGDESSDLGSGDVSGGQHHDRDGEVEHDGEGDGGGDGSSDPPARPARGGRPPRRTGGSGTGASRNLPFLNEREVQRGITAAQKDSPDVGTDELCSPRHRMSFNS